MGKEWLYWVGGGAKSTRRGRIPHHLKEESTSGCICSVFQIFDLHLPLHHQSSHFHPHNSLPLQLQQQEEEDTSLLKGMEAPRNSLESEEIPNSLALKEEEILNFPVGIRIKTGRENKSPRVSTSGSESRIDNLSSECSTSPGTKTPSLVARLMGLDMLPESPSPSSSRTVTKSQFGIRDSQTEKRDVFSSGARSLPETPRVSSGRRSDVEHRLSLQINKENFFDDFEIRNRKGENGNPGHYAREIVKQIKENISRKVGMDISNTVRNRELIRRDEHLDLLKPRNPSKILPELDNESMPGKQANPSRILTGLDGESRLARQANSSRILTGLDGESRPGKQPKPAKNITGLINNESRALPPELMFLDTNIIQVETSQKISIPKCKSSVKKSTKDSDAIRIKKEEPFIRSTKTNLSDKKSKKITPLSNEFLNTNVPTGLLPVKKDPTKLPSKQSQVLDALPSKKTTQLSSSSSLRSSNQENIKQDKPNGAAATSGERNPHNQYINKILKHTGIIHSNSLVSSVKWYSPSHPLDPSIFHQLELLDSSSTSTTTATLRCNRMLIFQLVDELLVDILKPSKARIPYGSDLVEELCKKIGSFPSANCEVLEDIDALVDSDLLKSSQNGLCEGGGESENVVSEIERRILDSLLHETVRVLFAAVRFRTVPDRCHMDLSRDEMLFIGYGTHV